MTTAGSSDDTQKEHGDEVLPKPRHVILLYLHPRRACPISVLLLGILGSGSHRGYCHDYHLLEHHDQGYCQPVIRLHYHDPVKHVVQSCLTVVVDSCTATQTT